MKDERASFIGIGAQKCATTWLYGVLQQVPQVCISDEKEVNFFNAHFDRGYEWYERHFNAVRDVVHRGEISPNYFVDADSPPRIAAYNPEVQILVTLRDPVDRAFSNHLHEVRKGHVSGGNIRFETAISNNPLYVEQGLYAKHLGHWYEHFPTDRIHIFYQEDINADPVGETARLTGALGVPAIADLLERRENASVAYRFPLVGESLWRLGQAARRKGLGRMVETVKAVPAIRTLQQANQVSVRETVPWMKDSSASRLTDLYADDVARLAKLTGRPPPWPRFNSGSSSVAGRNPMT